MSARLRVLLHGRPAGWLRRKDNGNLQFAYDDDYIESRGPAISCSMPVRAEAFPHRTCLAVFGGVLPEQDVRRAVAQLRGISPGNDYRLLEELGGDCAGALQFVVESGPRSGSSGARHIDTSELARILGELPRIPLAMGSGDGARLSLAGAHPKLPVIIDGDGIALPLSEDVPTTHILKPEPERFPGLVDNEFFCMSLARRLGLTVAVVERARTGDGLPFLIVERFDRDRNSEPVARVHQEDMCQALARLPDEKYQAEGGPTVLDVAQLLRRSGAVPALDIPRLWDAIVFNVLVGNCDAHGKNLSLLHAAARPSLAPLYDLVSTVAYPELTTRLAMTVGGATHLESVDDAALERCAVDCGMAPRGAITRARMLAGRALEISQAMCDESQHAGDVEVRICEGIAARARHFRG